MNGRKNLSFGGGRDPEGHLGQVEDIYPVQPGHHTDADRGVEAPAAGDQSADPDQAAGGIGPGQHHQAQGLPRGPAARGVLPDGKRPGATRDPAGDVQVGPAAGQVAE